MVERISEYAISVTTDHDENAKWPMVIGKFSYPEGAARETYTIAITASASLKLDAHFPARPDTISVQDDGFEESRESLALYLGEELTEQLFITRVVGSQALGLMLQHQQSLAIARLQLASVNTPLDLRYACAAMLGAQPKELPSEHIVVPRNDADGGDAPLKLAV